jgi:hypothetical protein
VGQRLRLGQKYSHVTPFLATIIFVLDGTFSLDFAQQCVDSQRYENQDSSSVATEENPVDSLFLKTAKSSSEILERTVR